MPPKTIESRPRARASLSTSRIVFLVIAAAAPLASMIGNLPIALGRGNGAGTPGAFLIAGVTLLLFAVGYAAMSRRIVNTGAFYTYITEGLGTAAGIGSAYVAMIAYVAFTFGLAAFFGYFTDLVLTQAGVHVPWPVYAGIGIALVAVLGYRSIDASSLILGALMIGEVVILAIFDGSVIESAARYGEEAADPKRSIPIATYTAVISVAVFYLFTAWVTIGALVPDDIAARANAESGALMFNVFTRYGGEVLTDVMGLLVCLSLLASYLAIHNAGARYIFALGREWLLPPWFGEAHPRHGAPSRASSAVSVMSVAAVAPFALSGLDPFKAGVPVLIGFGSFGMIFLQAFAAIAILVYLRRHGGEPAWVMAATWLGALGLIGATVFVAVYFKLLATNEAFLVGLLPLVFPAIALASLGIQVLLLMMRPKPAVARPDAADARPPVEPPPVRGDGGEDDRPGAWRVRYAFAVGREFLSEPRPTRAAAMLRARDLRDRRGATILDIFDGAAGSHPGDSGALPRPEP